MMPPDILPQLPDDDLVDGLERFFRWAFLDYNKETKKNRKDFLRCIGSPDHEFSHWQKGEWTNKSNPLRAQIAATARLLAVLNHDGKHQRYASKGVTKSARQNSLWGAYLDVHCAKKREWEARTSEIVRRLEEYLATLDEQERNQARDALGDAIMALAKKPPRRTNTAVAKRVMPQWVRWGHRTDVLAVFVFLTWMNGNRGLCRGPSYSMS